MSWRTVHFHPNTVFDTLNQSLLKLQQGHSESFPCLHKSNTLLIGSDYSGESPESPYSVYSFLFTTVEALLAWEQVRLKIRKRFFSDSRRMSFKKLGDSQRHKALPHLLEAADSLEGLSFSVAINKKCKSIFLNDSPLDLSNPDFILYTKWKKKVLQKAALTIHFLSFFIAGLSKKDQNIFWLTDEDSIAANEQRLRELVQLFSWISGQYISFPLGHFRCGTSKCDNGSKQIEDFLAIPDLIAGAISEQLILKEDDPEEFSKTFYMHRPDFSDKTKKITWWVSDTQQPLKRLLYIVNPTHNGEKFSTSLVHFYNQTE